MTALGGVLGTFGGALGFVCSGGNPYVTKVATTPGLGLAIYGVVSTGFDIGNLVKTGSNSAEFIADCLNNCD